MYTARPTATMARFAIVALGWLHAFFVPASAQTFTSCNPLNKTCPANPALGTSNTWDLTNATLDSNTWNISDGTVSYKNDQGTFTINTKQDSPTAISNFYIFFGSVSVIMKSAVGKGIVSSIALLSDDLDEIDWEWIGSNNTHVQTNYFGKGETGSFNRSTWVPVGTPQNTWHNYTIAWSQAQLEWWIDNKQVRVLPYAQAEGAGKNYPQTPLTVKVGLWKGGESKSQGTIDWAGGAIDWKQSPFSMPVQSIAVSDGTPNASMYNYGDRSGSFKSINVTHGTSVAASKLAGAPSQTITQKVNGLSNAAKIAIASSVGGVVLLLALAWTICCCKARRSGRRERAIEEANWDKRNQELMEYRRQMAAGRFGQGGGGGIATPPPTFSKF